MRFEHAGTVVDAVGDLARWRLDVGLLLPHSVAMAGGEGGGSREERLAQNEARSREENEHRSAWLSGHSRVAFQCECANPNCSELVSLDGEEYAALRASPIRFAVAPKHDQADVERVVDRHDGYWVTEKIGAGADVARDENDPPS